MKTNAEPQNKSNCSLFIRRGRQKNYWQAQTNGPGFTHFSGFFFNQTLRADRAPQAERPWQPSAFSWIYLILQHSEVMKARQTLGKEYTTTLFRAICLHLKKKKREKNPPSTGRSVNKSNRDRTSFMPDAHVRFVIPCSHLIKQKASLQPLSVAISMETTCTAAIRFRLNAARISERVAVKRGWGGRACERKHKINMLHI